MEAQEPKQAVTVAIRVTSELASALRRQAAADERSVSSVCKLAIREYLGKLEAAT